MMSRSASDEARTCREVRDLLKRCGADVDCVCVTYGRDADERPESLTCSYYGDMTFDVLKKVSRAFGTRLVDLGCETGTGSDPCHCRELRVRAITRLGDPAAPPEPGSDGHLANCRCGSVPVRCSGVVGGGVSVAVVVCRTPERHSFSEVFAAVAAGAGALDAEAKAEAFWSSLNREVRGGTVN